MSLSFGALGVGLIGADPTLVPPIHEKGATRVEVYRDLRKIQPLRENPSADSTARSRRPVSSLSHEEAKDKFEQLANNV